MIFLCELFLIILFMSINGSIFTIIWMFMKKIFRKQLRTDIVYLTLKLVIISFFIPVIYIIFIFKTNNEFGTQNYLMFFTKNMRLIFLPALAIVLIKFLYEIYKCIKNINSFSVFKEKRLDVDEYTRKIFDDVCDKIKIKRKFEIYKLPDVTSPFIYGYFNPVIYITEDDYTENVLRIALTHELFHYKKRDALWKIIVNIVCCLHWFNPLAFYIREEYKVWAEAEVDFNCHKYGGFEVEEYFDGIIEMAECVKRRFLNFLSFAGSRSLLYKRAHIMSDYSLNEIKPLPIFWVCVIAFASSVFSISKTSDAAGYLFNSMYDNTCVELKEDEIYYGDGYVEYTKKSTDVNLEDKKVIETFSQDKSIKEENVDIDITLQKNESYKVLTALLDCNDTICLAFMADKDNADFRIEIVEPDDVIRVIDTKTFLNYMLNIDNTGNYDIYITNISDEKIEINGSISFETR